MKITSFRLPTAFRPLALLSIGMTLAASPMARAQQTGTLATLYSFPASPYLPSSGLTLGSDGNFYGVTPRGASSEAKVFQLTPAGILTTLHTFIGGTDGSSPTGRLLPAGDGSFYGTTEDGGSNDAGSVYRITSAGVLTTLYSFPVGQTFPVNGVVLGSNGNFYGTDNTYALPEGLGGVFQLTPAGVMTALGGVGGFPNALAVGSDGNIYGTTAYGDSVGVGGAAFEITPAGAVTTLFTFTYDNNGGAPSGGLVQGSDGNFYGATRNGGANDYGTVYQLTPAGVLTILHTFIGGSDGGGPEGELVQAGDGNFYGTTSDGGTNNNGTVFQLTPAGTLTTLYAFTGNDGSAPMAGLAPGGDGGFYGTTEAGGADGDGTIYQLTVISRPAFFTGQVPLGNGVYYLVLPDGTPFGYYSFLNHSDYIYHFDLGYEYVLDANDGKDGVYLFDDATDDFFYTSPTFPFPYLYDFGLDTVLYYYPDPNNPGHYNLDGARTFYDFRLGRVIQD